jgi:hypothetical protein
MKHLVALTNQKLGSCIFAVLAAVCQFCDQYEHLVLVQIGKQHLQQTFVDGLRDYHSFEVMQ